MAGRVRSPISTHSDQGEVVGDGFAGHVDIEFPKNAIVDLPRSATLLDQLAYPLESEGLVTAIERLGQARLRQMPDTYPRGGPLGVHAVSRGDVYVHPAMTRALLHQPVTPEHRRGSAVDALIPREIDVLRLLVKGNTNRQVAGLLGISVRTVENHRANLMGKLGLSSRVELVSYAEEHDLPE